MPERGGLNLSDVFRHFQTPLGHRRGPAFPEQSTGRRERCVDAGRALRRVLRAVRPYRALDAARRLSALTHGDPAAGEGTAVLHGLVRVALAGGDPLDAVPEALAALRADQRERFAVVLAPGWHPDEATEFNGAVWPCLGSAVWALRTAASYEEAVRAAVDPGGDTDTVAAVTGAPAGAVRGIGAVPQRWTRALHVPLPGFGGRVLRTPELSALARRLSSP